MPPSGAANQRLMILSFLAGENVTAGRAPAQEFVAIARVITTILEG